MENRIDKIIQVLKDADFELSEQTKETQTYESGKSSVCINIFCKTIKISIFGNELELVSFNEIDEVFLQKFVS